MNGSIRLFSLSLIAIVALTACGGGCSTSKEETVSPDTIAALYVICAQVGAPYEDVVADCIHNVNEILDYP